MSHLLELCYDLRVNALFQEDFAVDVGSIARGSRIGCAGTDAKAWGVEGALRVETLDEQVQEHL